MRYGYNDIVTSLKTSGIKEGDTVFFTTSLGMIGIPPSDVDTQEKLNKIFFGAIKAVLGEKGTILVPTYSYTFGKSTITNPAVFDAKITPAEIGPFPNFFFKQPGVIRSLDPMMSIAGFGPRAREFLDNLPPTSYGEGSTFSRLVKSDAKCCNIGLGPNWTLFIHYADWLYQVPFRYDKFFHGLVRTNKRTKPLSWIYTVRILVRESIANVHKAGRLAEESGIWQYAPLGRARVYTGGCREYFDFICEHLEKDKWFLATGPAGDPFNLEEERVGARLTRMAFSKFDPGLWLKTLSTFRRDTVSESIDAAFDAISKHFPLSFSYYASGSQSLGWITPEKWLCDDAYITTSKGEIILSYESDPNFVRSYSMAVDKEVSREELLRHINIQPELAPFNYRDWGFCLPKSTTQQLTWNRYKVNIRSNFYYGKMRTAELYLKGTAAKTIVIASYLDGPYKVNESLSGLVVCLSLYGLNKNKDRNLNYIFLLLPGEVGFASWLSKFHNKLDQTVGIIHLKKLGLPLKPTLFSFDSNENSILKAAKSVLGGDSVKTIPSLFLPFYGNDNPMKQTFDTDIPQYIFCKVQLPSNSSEPFSEYRKPEDTKTRSQSIEDSINLFQNFINRLEEHISIL